ncbi:hypothetical protein RO3G_10550 [Rhizopus delemar RA 99-880]|uniref:Tc1-like transposase DDE domain-containing protein n=1 Tax=Rhizopus delemar (strain RA 99-880 / ATCC MYA-4621 / FGSC 9543 / NRRL 43880) TaxID=246409 RepID=I1CBL0_RHIO9|nr:hypothetical protein RO3G_10550 [Rhizopus delemar RA 99-880]|eukprot:EIE85840.1 hypothetical protein RO3G_10550 [Rhizopus delemar RA 99-880]
MQPISENLRNRIISCLKNGYSISKTANIAGASRGAAQNVRKTIKNEVNSIKTGRPKLLSNRDDQYLVRLVTVKGQENAVEARNMLENDLQKVVSAQTVRRSLRRSGLTSFVKPQKPLLSEVNRRKRLDWALNHVDWTIEHWKRVIWSDETKVNRFGSDGKVYSWKQPNEKLKRRHVTQTVKHGGGSLMVWSCISWYGVGYIVDVGKNMDKSVYLSVLQDDLVKSMADYCEENDLRMADFEFMQDNDPKHKSKIVSERLSKQDFTTMECPPQFPDLNPIENMWNILKKRLFKQYDCPPASMDELWTRTFETWHEITEKECQNYIETMPQRCIDIIENKGIWINF